MLRLGKDDLQQMIGVVDGVRLFNDLHMKPVSPRLTLYLAQKSESLFNPVLLQEVTVSELGRNISEIAEVRDSVQLLRTIFMKYFLDSAAFNQTNCDSKSKWHQHQTDG